MKYAISIFTIGSMATLSACEQTSQQPEAPVAQVSAPIVGGQDSTPHHYPYQLSLQRKNGSGSFSHSCGASLLSATRALTAAHCVDGAVSSNLKVVAGLHNRSDLTNTQDSIVASFAMHEDYNVGSATYANDIAILDLVTPITQNLPYVGYALLPLDNNDQLVGQAFTISGWGRTSSSYVLPNTLQEGIVTALSTSECSSRLNPVAGSIWDNQVCLFDTANSIGACNGDSGGPMSKWDPGRSADVVYGVSSFNVSGSSGSCLQTYPSVYTRTSAYLAWIASH